MKSIYTEEFRKMTVDLSYNLDKPLTHICKELGLSFSLLYKWRKEMSNVFGQIETIIPNLLIIPVQP